MKERSFEEMMQILENISSELESGKLTLDESLKKFEEGMEISKECSKILENAEKRITILTKKDNDEIEEDKFEND